jgi:Tfp pilus assembly protein PilO
MSRGKLLWCILAVCLIGMFGYGLHLKALQDEAAATHAEHERKLVLLRMEIENDELAIKDAEMKRDIAELHGVRFDPSDLEAAQIKLDAASQQLKDDENLDALFPQ